MRVLHPRPELGRQTFIGVEFVDGVAVIDAPHPEVVAALLQHGFTVENELVVAEDEAPVFEPLPTAADTEKVSKPLSKSQQKRLTELAKHIVPLTPEEEAGDA